MHLQNLNKAIEKIATFDILKISKRKQGEKVKARNRPKAIFDSTHPMVTDNKDHFPIDAIGRARNALARAAQYGKEGKPEWYKGTASSFRNAVTKAVKAEYPSIDVSPKKKADKITVLFKTAIKNLSN